MIKPLIGLNSRYEEQDGDVYTRLDYKYISVIKEAGGLPVILPFFETQEECQEALKKIDGVLLTGGADINPARWGEEKHPKTVLLPRKKEDSDFILAKTAIERQKPLLAICYGLQLINVVRGGSLFQHLPDIAGLNDAHSQKTNSQSPMHSIKIDQDSRLARILGKTEITVNSYHHQAVNKLGYKLLETGHSDDKIVEVIEMKQEGFFLAVQWHPERLNDKESALIFKEFVKSCNYG